MNVQKIKITATVDANLKKAWDYYTNPAHIIHWNFAHPSWCCPSAENDLRIGGKYRARMEATDGSFGFDFEGVYTKLVDGHSFTFVLGDEREVDLSFEEIEDGTLVTTIFDPETENPIELQQNGWQAILDNYKKYTESN
jgi:uncharacterized protein YndB with AHSA1/START domain